jgi:hypothetical protein
LVPRDMLEWFGMRGVRKTRRTAGRSHLSSSPFLLAFFPSLAFNMDEDEKPP